VVINKVINYSISNERIARNEIFNQFQLTKLFRHAIAGCIAGTHSFGTILGETPHKEFTEPHCNVENSMNEQSGCE